MSDAEIEGFIVQVDGVGLVSLPGTGPWGVHEYGFRNYEIRDAEGKVTNPNIKRNLTGGGGGGTKWDTNIVFATKSPLSAIVAAANAALAKGAA